MGFRLSASVEGQEKLQISLKKVSDTIDDLRPLWADLKPLIKDFLTDQFQSGGHGEWADRSPLYEKTLGTGALLAGTLRVSDRLYSSLSRETGDSIYQADKQEMVIGTKVPYAKYHQFGTKKMPARPIFAFTEKQIKELRKQARKSLGGQMKRSALIMTESNFEELG